MAWGCCGDVVVWRILRSESLSGFPTLVVCVASFNKRWVFLYLVDGGGIWDAISSFLTRFMSFVTTLKMVFSWSGSVSVLLSVISESSSTLQALGVLVARGVASESCK